MRHTSESTIIHKKYYVSNWGFKRIGIRAILYPPPIPPSVYKLIFLFHLIFISQQLKAQNIFSDTTDYSTLEIENITALEQSIKDYYAKEFYAQYLEWEDDGKGRVWTYLPDVGFAFGLPTVTLSTRQIKQAKKKEKQRKKKIDSTFETLGLKMNSDIQKLRVLYQKYQHNHQLLKEKMELLNIDLKIFAIYQEGYEKNEIEPLTYLQQKKSYIQSHNAIAEYTRSLKEEQTKIYILARYQLPSYPLLEVDYGMSHVER